MTKNPDDELVTKGAMKDAIRKLHTSAHYVGYVDELLVAIDKLPAVLPNSRQAGEIKSLEQIEQAIEYLEGQAEGVVADLLRLIIGQKPKGNFWDEEKIFGEPE